MMGVWFLGVSVGNFIGGRVGVALRVDAAAGLSSAPSPRVRSRPGVVMLIFARPLHRLIGDAA